jgi:flagellar biosynthesis anti-sigma factor FlgM
MKIPYIGKNDLKMPESATKSSRHAGKEASKSGGVRQDRIRLSKDVLQLLEMEKRFSASDDIESRTELVERLQRQIREGRYRPNSREVADKMIAEATRMLGGD